MKRFFKRKTSFQDEEDLSSSNTELTNRDTNNPTSSITNDNIPKEAAECPERKANWLSKLFYVWLEPLFWLGFKRPLVFEDLFQLDKRFQSGNLSEKFMLEWQKELDRSATLNKSPSLPRVLAKIFGRTWFPMGFLKFISDLTNIASPLMSEFIISFVAAKAKGGPDAPPDWMGYALVAGIFFLQIFTTVAQNYYFAITMQVGMSLRAMFTAVIYRKSLRLSGLARQDFTGGKIMNIVSSDLTRLDMISPYLQFVWTAPAQIIIIVALLIRAIGPAALAGVAILIFLTPFQGMIMRRLGVLRKSTAGIADRRVRLSQEILQGIRVIKFFAWEKNFAEKIDDLRKQEILNVRTSSIIRSFINTISFAIPVVASTIAFIVYGASEGLNAARLFSALALFNLLRFPLMFVPMLIGQWADMKVALSRVKALLLSPELEFAPSVDPNAKDAISITNGEFAWEVAPEKEANEDKAKSKRISLKRERKSMKKISNKSTENQSETISSDKNQNLNKDPNFPSSSSQMTAPNHHLPKQNFPLTPPSAISDINLSISKGKLVAIVGAVGSGKSSLLSAIVGEMKRISGDVIVSGSVGYCPQQAWIQNSSLQNNITFGLEMDRQKYQAAIRDSALEKDLQILPDGDQTEIGERGINLSGGQKQRVNLARCIYFDSDIVLLDDPLSAVDAHVGRYLFEKCILGALKNKTRLLVTHQLHFLPQVDMVICMRDGKVVEQGTFDELMKDGKEFSELMASYGGIEELSTDTEEEQDDDHDKDDDKDGNHSDVVDGRNGGVNKAKDKGDIPELDKTLLDSDSKIIEKAAEKIKEKKSLMTVEERATGAVPLKMYFAYFKEAGGFFIASLILLFLFLSQATRVGSDLWLVQWTNNAIPTLTQQQYIGIYFAWGIVETFTTFAFNIIFAIAGVVAAKNLHYHAIQRVLRAPMRFFDTTPLGRIINRFSKDQDAIDNTLSDAFRMFLSTAGTTIATFVLILYATPIFGIPLVPLLIIYYFVQLLYRNTSRELKRLDSISRSPLYAHFGETMTGLPTIRAYREQYRFTKRNDGLIDSNMRPYFLQIMAQRWLGVRLESIGGTLVGFAGLFGVIGQKNQDSAALIGLSLSYALQVTSTLSWMVRQFTETEIQMNAVERVHFYANQLEVEAPPVIESYPLPHHWPEKGEIKVESLELKYAPDLPSVLHGISFHVKPNEKIGVVGRTGSGKSSLMVALFRIVDPFYRGRILIDDVDISKIGLNDLRTKLSIIPQDPILFSGTVRSNLDPFNQHSDQEIWDVLERASVKTVVMNFETKLDAPVHENGENFSVGQRQLFCLARAMLRRPKIIVLDEVTASIDLETDASIQQVLRKDFANCTILTIAHRLNGIIDYDRVLVLDNGHIVEYDAPGALLQNPSSQFSQMVNETGPTNAALLRSQAFKKQFIT